MIASPVHKGSYAGLFKHVFDLLDPGMSGDRRLYPSSSRTTAPSLQTTRKARSMRPGAA
ncbi:hypothetical protein [Paracoccus mutanolyticus]|uniref:hypothetical protein n=1 Tax=Paracoccus mutanolyticus TaxID=1499308 RepID=UPI001CB8EA0A|nr:hypothetical protein [Paracoccus mutanolyticus]